MGFVSESRERVRPILPLAGMVDVLFLLLIFFMTASAFREAELQIDVSLPATESERARSGVAAPVIITVTEEGELFLGEQGHTVESLKATLAQIAGEFPNQQVLVRGDRTSAYGLVVQVMDAAYAVGLSNVFLATTKSAQEIQAGGS